VRTVSEEARQVREISPYVITPRKPAWQALKSPALLTRSSVMARHNTVCYAYALKYGKVPAVVNLTLH
jgi:hypothetical protein